jgi:hypothetical protein
MSAIREQWDTEGYVTVGGVFDDSRVENLLRICNDVLRQFLECCPEKNRPGGPDDRCMRNLHRRSYFESNPDDFVFMMEAFADSDLSDIVEEILGKKILFRGTSYWFAPKTLRSAGNWHRDVQYMVGTVDEQKEFVQSQSAQTGAQLMLALLPTECNEYLPGSHLRWDTDEELQVRMGDELAEATVEIEGAVRVKQSPGDVAIFNATGLHRGQYYNDVPRRTVMITYTTEDTPVEDYFSDAPWCLEPGYLDGLHRQGRDFYQRYMDRYSEFWKRPREGVKV